MHSYFFYAVALVIILAFPSNTEGQSLQYRDISYEYSTAESQPALIVNKVAGYIRVDPFDAAQYHLLGFFYYQRCTRYNILKDYQGSIIFADSAFFYFQKAKDLLDEKNLKNQQAYYNGFFSQEYLAINKSAALDTVARHLDRMISEVRSVRSQVYRIHQQFNQAAQSYYEALQAYSEIAERYTNIEEVYLLANEALARKLTNIRSAYDSSMANFDRYKSLVANSPFKDYNESLSKTPIRDFKKDGIEKVNFLDPKLVVWDYSSWIVELEKAIETEVKPLRKEILDYHQKLANSLQGNLEDVPENTQLVKKLNKFDPNSVILDFFAYQSAKISYLRGVKTQRVQVDELPTQENAFPLIENTTRNSLKCIDLLRKFEENATALNITKHSEFFETNLNSTTKFVDQELATYYGTIEEMLFSQIKKFENDTVFLSTSAGKLPLFTDRYITAKEGVPVENILAAMDLVTKSIDQDQDGNTYLCGYRNEAKAKQAFVAKVYQDTLEWIKFPSLRRKDLEGDISSSGLTLRAGKNGCAAMVYTYMNSDEKFGHNTLFVLDIEGEVLLDTTLTNDHYPQTIDYTADGEGFLLTFKGYGPPADSLSLADSYLQKHDKTGVLHWEKTFQLAGNISRVVADEKLCFLLTNFNSFQFDPDSKRYTFPENSKYPQSLNFLLASYSIEDGSLKSANYHQDARHLRIVYSYLDDNNHLTCLGILYPSASTDQGEGKLCFFQLDENLRFLRKYPEE